MHLLGFSFPPDDKRTAKTLKDIPVDYMLRIRQMFLDEYTIYLSIMDDLKNRLVHTYCDVCDEEEWSYDDIPTGWGWYDGQVQWYMMCTKCQTRYKDRFGKEPEILTDIDKGIEAQIKEKTDERASTERN